jgi:hypothetical protein
MKKVITASVVAVLLVASSAMAQIDLQYQYWNFGLSNDMDVAGGPGVAETIQSVGTLSVQNLGINPDVGGVDPTATASQGIGLILVQGGETETGGAHVGLLQNLNIQGIGITVNGAVIPAGQAQQIGDLSGPTMQYEGVAVSGDQTLDKARGSDGESEGFNLAGFGMGQSAGNNCADGCQLSVILGAQFSELEGAAQATGTIVTSMTATVQQFQTANNVAPVEP